MVNYWKTKRTYSGSIINRNDNYVLAVKNRETNKSKLKAKPMRTIVNSLSSPILN